jgi:hypothetical protein
MDLPPKTYALIEFPILGVSGCSYKGSQQENQGERGFPKPIEQNNAIAAKWEDV